MFLLTAAVAVVFCIFFSSTEENSTGYSFDLNETGGAGGFLSQFSLEYDKEMSKRELTLPSKNDKVFTEYADFQSELGLNILKFSGKRVEERYLRLKNKSKSGEKLYAVLYIYKEEIIAAHLTALEQEAGLLQITAFV